MNVNRSALAQHLTKITCNGQIEGAVFTDAFSSAALSPDHLLLVLAPELDGADPLKDDLGIPWLDTWLSALNVISGEKPTDTVEVRVEGHHLVIDEQERGVLRLIAAAPKTIGTFITPETVKKLEDNTPADGDGIALTPQLVSGIQDTFKLFKATEVELFLDPEGGRVRVGNENSNVAEFAAGELKDDEEYSLLFGPHLVDVLGVVNSGAALYLNGPEKPVLIKDGSYRYILAPRSRGADGA